MTGERAAVLWIIVCIACLQLFVFKIPHNLWFNYQLSSGHHYYWIMCSLYNFHLFCAQGISYEGGVTTLPHSYLTIFNIFYAAVHYHTVSILKMKHHVYNVIFDVNLKYGLVLLHTISHSASRNIWLEVRHYYTTVTITQYCCEYQHSTKNVEQFSNGSQSTTF